MKAKQTNHETQRSLAIYLDDYDSTEECINAINQGKAPTMLTMYQGRPTPLSQWEAPRIHIEISRIMGERIPRFARAVKAAQAIAEEWIASDPIHGKWAHGYKYTRLQEGDMLEVGDVVYHSGIAYHIERVTEKTAFSYIDSRWKRTVAKYNWHKLGSTIYGSDIAARREKIAEKEPLPNLIDI